MIVAFFTVYRRKGTNVVLSILIYLFIYLFSYLSNAAKYIYGNVHREAVRNTLNYFDIVTRKFIVNNRTDAWKTDVNLFFTINCVHSR